MRVLILSIFIFSGIFAQTYCAGDQISTTHQNKEYIVGAGVEGYAEGDIFKLADWNGDLNGGNYHIIFIDMGAAW